MSVIENARNLANVLKFNDDLTLLSLTGMSDESARRQSVRSHRPRRGMDRRPE